jgi:hypothetical protein
MIEITDKYLREIDEEKPEPVEEKLESTEVMFDALFDNRIALRYCRKLLRPEYFYRPPARPTWSTQEDILSSIEKYSPSERVEPDRVEPESIDPEVKKVIQGSKFLQKLHRIRSLQESKRKYLAITKKDKK